MYNYSAKSL